MGTECWTPRTDRPAMTDHDILLFSSGTLRLESLQQSSFGRRLDGDPMR